MGVETGFPLGIARAGPGRVGARLGDEVGPTPGFLRQARNPSLQFMRAGNRVSSRTQSQVKRAGRLRAGALERFIARRPLQQATATSKPPVPRRAGSGNDPPGAG